MPEVIKKLSAADAYKHYLKNFELKYKIADKFSTDHLLAAANLSKTTSIDAAIERYTRNQNITTSSWMLLDTRTLLNKAKGAKKGTQIHNGAQQMSMQISVTRRTVTIAPFSKKELQGHKLDEYKNVKIKEETHYLYCSSREKDVKINVMGPWNPLTGDVSLYHYDEGQFDPTHTLLPSYREWFYDNESKTYLRPVAKK